jgi:hypothetical protein
MFSVLFSSHPFFFDREEEKQNSEEDITISAIRNDMWRLI